MKRTRILHLRASNFVGGPERQILRYATFEREGPAEVIIGTFRGEREGRELAQAAASEGTAILEIEDSGVLRMAADLEEAIGRDQIAMVCTHGYKATIVGMLACRALAVPVAPFLRGFTGEDARVSFYEWLERRALPFCARVVCLSEQQQERITMRRGLAAKARVVANAIAASEFTEAERQTARERLRQRFGIENDAVVVASAGRLSPEKGTEFFLRALAGVEGKHENVHAIVFGDGPLAPELKTLAQSLQLRRVTFAGHVPEFRELLPGFDLVVNPSLSEEMPNVILEAMAAATPVIATEVGGVSEIAGENSLRLVKAGDTAALEAAIAELAHSALARKALGQAGQIRVRHAFAPARQQQQLRALYSEVLPWLSFEPTKFESAETAAAAPFISVVIPVRNEEKHIGNVLGALLSQNYPAQSFEVIVADGNSTDRTREVVEKIADNARAVVRWIPNPRQLSSAGRNAGARQAKGDIVLFVDGHCHIAGTSLLAATAQIMEQSGADCLCRPQPPRFPGNTWFQSLVASARASSLGHGRGSIIYSLEDRGPADPTSAGATYRRSVFDKIGWYDENFDACEDVEFNHRVKRAGLRSVIDPSLAVFYQPRATLGELFRQLVRYGQGRRRLMRKHRDAFSVSQMIPPALALWTLLALLAFAGPWQIRALAWIPMGIYAALVAAFAARLTLRHGWKSLSVAPAIYTAIHFGLGWGFWKESLAAKSDAKHQAPEIARASAASAGTPAKKG